MTKTPASGHGLYVKVEAEGMMNAHIKDAVALCDWAARMEYEIQANWLFFLLFS
jgi:hypothetical protein